MSSIVNCDSEISYYSSIYKQYKLNVSSLAKCCFCWTCLVIEGIRSSRNEAKVPVTKSVTDIKKNDLQLPDTTENSVDKCKTTLINVTGLDQ